MENFFNKLSKNCIVFKVGMYGRSKGMAGLVAYRFYI